MSCFYFCFFLLIFVFKVLGYPEKNFVDNRHADLLSINGKVETQRTYRTVPLGDLFNS